ncbi:hypothetical protein C7974DRAFT_39272 [Boeremia exigua]|uniref:uncharacterized protein n=1 Tax=Boeremia exigua TaxID=749465 RepID=UPI001E8E02C3|nr:uncharacterized protein C7974DRAFT_39272 [Boeremia exigua]KAH6618907.1 hypothetical protein C7974DRAFT_39272 [Boeremia exigua]
MAASDLSPPYQYIAMSAGRGQGADVSGPWPPAVLPVQQRQRWHDLEGAFSQQADSGLYPIPQQYRNSPYPQPSYPQSPYAPYTVHGGHPMQMHPPSTLPFSSHQPRPPPAIRSGHVDALMHPNRSGYEGYPEAAANYGYYPGHQSFFNDSVPPQSNVPVNSTSDGFFEINPSMQGTSGGGTEHQFSQTLPLHPGPYGIDQPQRPDPSQRRLADRNAGTRHVEHTESRIPRNLTTQARRPDRSSSPRTSTRRNFNRYSADLSHSSTSSDVEEAAARSPPSDRIRHQSRERRLRFFRQVYDPNMTTECQLHALKANMPKFLLGNLPQDVSPTCDICAKDYAANHVHPSEEEEIALKLPCGHIFGEFCIGQWFDTCKTHKNKVTCPMCRKQLIESPRSPFSTDRLDATMFNSTVYLQAARNSQSFRDLLANELQAHYARA